MTTDTTGKIKRGTGRALCEYGYADLTRQRIAAESSVSTAAIHYHFDTKEELLNAFLDDILERFEQQVTSEASDPRDRLQTLLDGVFAPTDGAPADSPISLMVLKSQAPYHESYRERFCELDHVIQRLVATTVREGIDAGHFDESDPDEVAQFVSTAINGAHARLVALGEDADNTCQLIESYLDLQLGWTPKVLA